VTIGVAVVLVLGVVAPDAAPTRTIGFAGVEVLVESAAEEEAVGGGFWPFGITMGVDLLSLSPPLSLPVSLPEFDFNCGGQSTDVGGQLSVLPEPDEPGGGQPAPAPKSPGVVQSAFAMPSGSNATHPASEKAAAAIRIRLVLTASGCPRRR
jgi:hypothetical protein